MRKANGVSVRAGLLSSFLPTREAPRRSSSCEPPPIAVEYDRDKVDEAVLALLWLTTTQEHGFKKAWKGQDWNAKAVYRQSQK